MVWIKGWKKEPPQSLWRGLYLIILTTPTVIKIQLWVHHSQIKKAHPDNCWQAFLDESTPLKTTLRRQCTQSPALVTLEADESRHSWSWVDFIYQNIHPDWFMFCYSVWFPVPLLLEFIQRLNLRIHPTVLSSVPRGLGSFPKGHLHCLLHWCNSYWPVCSYSVFLTHMLATVLGVGQQCVQLDTKIADDFTTVQGVLDMLQDWTDFLAMVVLQNFRH